MNGTRQRCSGESQRRQCGEAMLHTFVTPGSTFLPFKAKAGDGMPHRIMERARAPSRMRISAGRAGIVGGTKVEANGSVNVLVQKQG